MPYELIAYGSTSDIPSIGNYESSFQEGDRGYLDLCLVNATPDIIAQAINDLNHCLLGNIEGYSVEAHTSLIRIRFKVAIPPLVIIAVAVAAVIILIGVIVAWKLYRLSAAGVVLSVGWLILAAGLSAAAAIALLMVIRKYAT